MTTRGDTGYAPLGLDTEPEALGLSRISVASAWGTAVAHHRRTTTSPRATVFLHGAAGSWTTWTPLLRTADAAGVAISNPILLDLPGWGEGTLTAAGEALAIETVCHLVKDCAEELGFTEWDIVGHSMGGFIAMHMASIWPQSVISVGIVSGTAYSVIESVEHPVRRFAELPAFTLLWRGMLVLTFLGAAGDAIVRFARALGIMRFLTRPLFRHPGRIPASVISALGEELRPRTFGIAAEIARGYNADSTWGAIECPVRALKGDRDVFSTPSDLERIGRVLPASERIVIPDCGHFAAIERPWATLVGLGYALG